MAAPMGEENLSVEPWYYGELHCPFVPCRSGETLIAAAPGVKGAVTVEECRADLRHGTVGP